MPLTRYRKLPFRVQNANNFNRFPLHAVVRDVVFKQDEHPYCSQRAHAPEQRKLSELVHLLHPVSGHALCGGGVLASNRGENVIEIFG